MKHTVTEVKLKNGARGLFIDVPGATVMGYDFNFVAGDFLSPEGKWDTAHLMEHLVLGGNERIKNGRAYNAELEKNGALTNAYTSVEYVGYWAECADFEWDRVLDLLLAGITKPLFTREEFKAEWGNVKDEMIAYTNNHFSHLHSEARKQYGLLDATDRERVSQLKNIRRADVVDHYKRTHTTSNLRFIIGGDLKGKRAKLQRMLEAISLPKGRGRIELLRETPHNMPKPPLYVSRPSVRNTHFFLHTFSLGWMDDDRADALALVNNMLTGTLHSRIMGEAREKGLVYHVDSRMKRTLSKTSWFFSAQVMPKNAAGLFDIIVRELDRVKSGDISPEDLEAAKQYEIGRYQRRGQTVIGTMNGYGRYFFDGMIEDYDAFADHVKGITKARIVDTVNTMFKDKIGGLSLLGNKKTRELSDQLYDSTQSLWR